MVSFTFEFDKPDKKYKAGETIACTVKISVPTKFKAKSLLIRFKGIAHTEWSKTGSNKSTQTYSGDEEYFKNDQYMFGNDSSNEIEVEPKNYTYDVAFKLPEKLPSNIENSYGHVKYSVKVKYDVAWGFDKSETAFFTVIPNVDLNEIPLLREPVKEETERKFGFLCFCESHPMHLICNLQKSGYVPGETIPITIEVDNKSNVRINTVRIKLKEYLTFVSQDPETKMKNDTNTVTKQDLQVDVAPFQKKEFEATINLDSNYDYKYTNDNSIITCEYQLILEAIPSGCRSNAEIMTKLVIGTIPFNVLVYPTLPANVEDME